MVGRDCEPPYERPPLSKEYLAGDKPFERILIHPLEFWAERNVELMLKTNVSKLNPVAKELTVPGGRTISYGTLIWAAGGEARRLCCPGAALTGLHTVRDKSDTDALSAGPYRRPDARS